MWQPKISIIIPVYNSEAYLDRCLQSIIGQSEQNWECILVDDGSMDGSGKKCDEYSKEDGRFKVYHQTNHGPSSSRNYGMDSARGEYICFIDSDDYVGPDFLKHLIEPMEKDVAVKMTVIGMETFGASSGRFPKSEVNMTLGSKEVFAQLMSGTSKLIRGWLCNKCFKREIISAYRLNEELRYCEDLEMQLRLLYDEPDFPVVFVNAYDYYYYMSEGGKSLSHNSRNKISMFEVFDRLLDVYPDSKEKRIRMVKNAFNQCRYMANMEIVSSEDNVIIKKCRRTILKYWAVALKNLKKTELLQILVIIMNYKLYRKIMIIKG